MKTKLDTLVQEATVEHLGIATTDYDADKTLEQLGADDLDVIGFLMHLEDKLRLPQFPDDQFNKHNSPREIIDWLQENVFAAQ